MTLFILLVSSKNVDKFLESCQLLFFFTSKTFFLLFSENLHFSFKIDFDHPVVRILQA